MEVPMKNSLPRLILQTSERETTTIWYIIIDPMLLCGELNNQFDHSFASIACLDGIYSSNAEFILLAACQTREVKAAF